MTVMKFPDRVHLVYSNTPPLNAYSARKYEYLHDHMLVLSTSKSPSGIYLITFTYILYMPLTLPTIKQNYFQACTFYVVQRARVQKKYSN
jgi:hypothetical protein